MTVGELKQFLAAVPDNHEISIRTCRSQMGLPVYHKKPALIFDPVNGKVALDVSYMQGDDEA